MQIKVTCILPAIEGDEQDSVCIKDEDDEDLEKMVSLVKKGYKIKIEDWEKEEIDINSALEQIAQESYKFGKTDHESDSITAKVDKLIKLVEEGFKEARKRLSKIERKLHINNENEVRDTTAFYFRKINK